MNAAIEIIGFGVIVPAGISVVLVFLCSRFFPPKFASRNAAAVALAAAFFAGYVLLPSWAELIPKRHWHWLPYLAAGAMVLGPLGLAEGVAAIERWLLYGILALASACLLVPTWTSLEPPRVVYISILTAYLFLLTVLLQPLSGRVSGKLLVAVLSLAAITAALLTAGSVSLRYGRLAGIAAAAMTGCCAAALVRHDEENVRGLVPVYCVLIGGCAFVGFVEPEPPQIGILMIPAAPLAMWACATGPLARTSGWTAVVIQAAIALIPIIVGIALTVMR